jgi:hypothetical protein
MHPPLWASYNLCPLAWNFFPRAVSAPPPDGFVWQEPHPSFVCAAYAGVAVAGRWAKAAVNTNAIAAAGMSAKANLPEILEASMTSLVR